MGSCAAPSAKGDDKFITTDYLQQCLYLMLILHFHMNQSNSSMQAHADLSIELDHLHKQRY
ncbi:hypothetical protein DQQ26_13125 [Acinetobacter baumannii]|nr:hypothetical protein [Acinetobacter baumannii]